MGIETKHVLSPHGIYSEFQCGLCQKLVGLGENNVSMSVCGHVFCSMCFAKTTAGE